MTRTRNSYCGPQYGKLCEEGRMSVRMFIGKPLPFSHMLFTRAPLCPVSSTQNAFILHIQQRKPYHSSFPPASPVAVSWSGSSTGGVKGETWSVHDSSRTSFKPFCTFLAFRRWGCQTWTYPSL